MRSDTVVGYSYRADNYCPECIVPQIDGQAPTDDPEAKLDYIAMMLGFDRHDERTFDSGDFPKVIFADMVHDVCTAENGYDPGQCGDQCGQCGEHLGFDCPNVAQVS